MTTETLEIRQMARQFAESDLRPHVEKWDHDGAIPDDLLSQIAELGFFGMLVPESEGGTEFDLQTYAAALEELAWGEPAVALVVATANAMRAQPEDVAELGLVTTAPGMFLVPGTKARLAERLTTLGFRPIKIFRAEADAPQPGAESLIGVAAIAVGIAQAALDHARGYADVREQFSTKLREFEGIQAKLADMAIRVQAARALLQSVAAAPTLEGAAMAKVFASEAAMWVTTQAVQIFGGYGYMRDYPVEKLMRDAKATELLQGANEVLRVQIARALYND